MKQTNTCPKCGGRRIWAIERGSHDEEGRYSLLSSRVAAARDRLAGGRILQVGTFECRICASCGLTEWYARDFHEGLTALANDPHNGVRLIDTTPQRGPFR